MPAVSVNTRSNELKNTIDWATTNNLSLNLSKSEETVIVDKRRNCTCRFDIPKTIGLDGLRRVENIKILGVTLANGLSVTLHFQHIITSNAQVLYAVKVLRAVMAYERWQYRRFSAL